MMSKQINVLSPFAIAAAVALFAVAFAGCDRREEVYPAEGNAYMHDPEFRAQLDASVKVRNGLAKSSCKANAELNAYIKENGFDFVAATNTPRGAELYATILRNEQLMVSNRIAVAKLTRERMKRAQADSERIKRGEAKAKEISKKETK